MEKEKKQAFVRRIAESNRTELIVILYDILDYDLAEAEQAIKDKDWTKYQMNLNQAEQVLTRLVLDLDFQYEIAGELYRLYRYCLVELAKAKVIRKETELEHMKVVLNHLHEAMKELAKTDDSEPLMAHTQRVVAGMTYHKTNLTEVYQDPDASRGFFA